MRVAVIGAGIQGICAALELARRGCTVDLYEKDPAPISRASRWNEGKVHLGFVYARDETQKTAQMAQRGAFSFWELLGRWIDTHGLESALSEPFIYAVHRDSVLDVESVEAHLRRVVADARLTRDQAGGTYLGDREPFVVERLSQSELEQHLSADMVAGAFRTAERSIDPGVVADALTTAISAESRVELAVSSAVTAIEHLDNGQFRLRIADHEPVHDEYRVIVNASWEDRLRLDATSGLSTDRPRLFRYKLALHGKSPKSLGDLPSVTTVAGPFGDVVRFPNDGFYLSWYPSCMIGSSTDLSPPDFAASLNATRRASVLDETVSALQTLVPQLAAIDLDGSSITVDGGFIFTWGATDITDPSSELHQRSDIGVHSDRNYHSIDTGKYGMAPVFAVEVADRIIADPNLRE